MQSQDQTWTQQFDFKVAPNTAKTIRIDFTLKKVRFPFTANFTVSGQLRIVKMRKQEITKDKILRATTLETLQTYDENLKTILSESERQYTLNGWLEVSHANQADIVTQVADAALPNESQNCQLALADLKTQIDRLNEQQKKLGVMISVNKASKR